MNVKQSHLYTITLEQHEAELLRGFLAEAIKKNVDSMWEDMTPQEQHAKMACLVYQLPEAL